MNDEQSAAQFLSMMDAMQQHGFEHYEISNFAKPGHYSRHNSNYWKGARYLGIGPSAHSYNGETRQWNIANNAKYLESLENSLIPAETELLSETDRLNEYIMTSIRTMWGLDLDKLNAIAKGSDAELLKNAPEFLDKGYVELNDRVLRLTQTGKLYADHVAAELFF